MPTDGTDVKVGGRGEEGEGEGVEVGGWVLRWMGGC